MTPDQLEDRLDDLRDEVSAIEDDLRDGGDPVVAQRNLKAARIGLLSVDRAAFSVSDNQLQGEAREALSDVDRLIDRAARLAAVPPPPPPPPPPPLPTQSATPRGLSPLQVAISGAGVALIFVMVGAGAARNDNAGLAGLSAIGVAVGALVFIFAIGMGWVNLLRRR